MSMVLYWRAVNIPTETTTTFQVTDGVSFSHMKIFLRYGTYTLTKCIHGLFTPSMFRRFFVRYDNMPDGLLHLFHNWCLMNYFIKSDTSG